MSDSEPPVLSTTVPGALLLGLGECFRGPHCLMASWVESGGGCLEGCTHVSTNGVLGLLTSLGRTIAIFTVQPVDVISI